jgi:hypothetical protein
MTWHVETAQLARYADGETDAAHSFSIESHLLECDACREQIAGLADHDRLELVWADVEQAIGVPTRRPAEAVLLRLGTPEHVARLLAATPSLTLSWLIAVAGCLAFAVAAAHVSSRGLLVFLALAPLLPVAGVAAAYGPGVDPSYEISLATPTRGFRLLLIRATAVLASTSSLAGVAALALPDFGWLTAAWLLPSLALTALGLALATYVDAQAAFASVAFAWVAAVVLSASTAGDLTALFQAGGQVGFLVVAVAATLVVLQRRDEFDQEGAA